MPNPKEFNRICRYIWDVMQKRRPGDTLYALAKRIGIDVTQLYRTFTRVNPFAPARILMLICSDLGIPMEEPLTGAKMPKDYHKQELELWKDKAFEWERRYLELENIHKNLLKKINSLKEQ